MDRVAEYLARAAAEMDEPQLPALAATVAATEFQHPHAILELRERIGRFQAAFDGRDRSVMAFIRGKYGNEDVAGVRRCPVS